MRKIIYILAFFYSGLISYAQIAVDCSDPFESADSLVELIIGEGLVYSNATLSAFDCFVGYFDGVNSNIGFNSGLVMSTNSINSVSGGVSLSSPGFGEDEDLSQLMSLVGVSDASFYDVLVLEFDFVPLYNELSFNYVFGSNEYTTNTCNSNADVFGFFISGEGISGPYSNNAENIALVPDVNNPGTYTNTPVLVNTVNSGVATSGSSTACDNIDPNWQNYSNFYVDNSVESTVNLPGFTIPLIASSDVVPCKTYHLKIIIADAVNNNRSSALFIEENSFNSLNTSNTPTDFIVTSNASEYFSNDSDNHDVLFEGCGDASIKFVRPDILTGDVTLLYHLIGDAQLGVDFEMTEEYSNEEIFIPADQSEIEIIITPFSDAAAEGQESIIFQFDAIDYGCMQYTPDLVVFDLVDQPDLNFTLTEDFSISCPGDDAELVAEITGGVGSLMTEPFSSPPYTYEWSHIGTAPTQIENPLETTEYCVEATDVCKTKIFYECVEVSVPNYSELRATTQDVYLCDDVQEELCVFDVYGGDGNYSYLWSNGSTGSCMFDYDDEYTVVVSDGCDEQLILEPNIVLDDVSDPLFDYILIPSDKLEMEFHNLSSNSTGVSYLWNFGDGTYSDVEDPIHTYSNAGTYEVSLSVISNLIGCSKEYVEYISLKPPYFFYAPNTFTPNGDGVNDTFFPIITGVSSYEIFIFDSYGKLVFNTKDNFSQWDGTYEGKVLSEGTYIYKITMSRENDIVIFDEEGTINLIR